MYVLCRCNLCRSAQKKKCAPSRHPLIAERRNNMAQGLNSTKSAARLSHEAIEDETTANEGNKSD